ncbi:YqaA family protein [Candidatus Alkanophaga liquidiphilum]|nr:putative membrane protein YqaA [Candidatus Alkanophaga liquidiphilum]
MGVVEGAIAWSSKYLLPYGTWGLFAVAFAEASFFVAPPDVLLIPIALAAPERALFYALVTTLGSTLGGIFGYFIGLKGGRPLLLKFASEGKVQRVDEYFGRYGALAVGIAGFTPIPYKIFTISAGVFRMSLTSMVVASLLSRGARFFLEATLLMLYGDEIIVLVEGYFEVLTLLAAAVFLAAYFLYIKSRRRMSMAKRRL